MTIKINNVEIPSPSSFQVTVADIDGDNTARTADGGLNRDRIAVKRKIEMDYGIVDWATASAVLTAVSGVFFEINYPDPQTGTYATITAYVSDRPCVAAIAKGDAIMWSGLKFSIVER